VLVPDLAPILNLGPGCGVPSAPVLAATGSPARATIPNATFGLLVSNLTPGNSVVINYALATGNLSFPAGCTVWIDPASFISSRNGTADGSGNFAVALPVPNDPSLEGQSLAVQAAEVQAGGALFGQFDLTNGIEIEIGSLCR
jgi:hypothetical protein